MPQLEIARNETHPSSSNTLAEFIDLAEDAIVSVNRDRRIVFCNRAAERLFGYTAAEILGQPLEVLLPRGCDRDRGGQIVEFPGTKPADPVPADFIASSESMRQLVNFARRVAVSEAVTILIEGESGVGKDVLARFIHETSRRGSKPFLAINCAAIPETLLESELFGYERGAFTDARNQKSGILEVASGGTVFLDEIGELPLTLQAKLLRVLEEHRFRRLGGTKDVAVDLRVITATNRDLRKAVAQGRFRADLYYRLNVIQTTIPPLRDRPADIAPLAHHFVALYNRRFRRDVKGFAADALSALQAHTWPGNIRELRNAIERAMLMQDGDWIRATDLAIRSDFLIDLAGADELDGEPSLADIERVMVVNALNKASWNQTRASHLLKISRDSMRYKMKKFNLRPPAAA